MAGSATVGALKVLMSADSAQITQDLGKARRAVREAQADFALFGRAGKDAKSVLIDLGDGAAHGGRAAKELGTMLGRAFGGFNREGAEAVKILTEGISGGMGKATLAAGAAMAAVGYAVNRIEEAYKEMKAAEEEYSKGSKDRLNKAIEGSAEALDKKLGAGWAKVSALAREAEVAERKAAAAAQAFQDSGAFGRGSASKKAAMDKAANEAEAARARAVEAGQAQMEKQKAAVEDLDKALKKLGSDRSAAAALEALPPPLRKAEEEAAKLKATFSELLDKAVPGEKQLAEYLQQGKITSQEYYRGLRARASEEKWVAHVLGEQTDYLKTQASGEFLKPFQERWEKTRAAAEAAAEGVDQDDKDAELVREITRLRDLEGKTTGRTRDTIREALGYLSGTLGLERRISGELKEQAAAKKAATAATAMRRDNDLAASLRGAGENERARALAENAAARREALEGVKEGSKEELDLVTEFRRKEEGINLDFDKRALEAQRDFLGQVDSMRRNAAAQVLLDDKNQTRLRLDEEDARHSAEIQRVNAAYQKGLLTEEQADAKRAGLTRAHIDFRTAIEREGRDRELAWQAAYQSRLLELQMQGITDEAALARGETANRLAALQEETRQFIDELERRGEMQKAQEVRNARDAAAARIRQDGRIQEGLVGDSFGEGFKARMTLIERETAGWGRLGDKIAVVATQDLSAGLANALMDVEKGAATAKEAFREFAADFAFQVAGMIQQFLILKAITGLFGGLGMTIPGAAPVPASAPAGAHGGTWRVGGYGGLDSQLVRMRLSPGEIVKVSNGANSGGEGIVLENHLVVRSPILADDVADGMSREAKAGIVASAVRRGSRRGGRPQE